MKKLRFCSFVLIAIMLTGAVDVIMAAKAIRSEQKKVTIAGQELQTTPTPVVKQEVTAGSETATIKDKVPQGKSGEQINWQVIASSGGMQTLGSLQLGSTLGQSAAGVSSLGSFTLRSGFWQDFRSWYLCGDVDHTDDINISDAVYLVCYIFGDCAAPVPLESGDVDCDVTTTIADVVYLVNFIFGDGQQPCANCP